jgi:GAF domain-containing protein
MQNMKERYEELLLQVKGLAGGEENAVGALANVTAAMREMFPERYFWVGFYIVDNKQKKLRLGPFQGSVACYEIGYGRGVCGTSWQRDETIVVGDVEKFPGHIACSSLSRSEIVVPVHGKDGSVVAVLDIDSDKSDTFGDTDKDCLEQLVKLLPEEIFVKLSLM